MVQTEQQYICIHQCLMAVLEGKENTGPPREIHDNQGYEGGCKSLSFKPQIFLKLFCEGLRKLTSIRHFVNSLTLLSLKNIIIVLQVLLKSK